MDREKVRLYLCGERCATSGGVPGGSPARRAVLPRGEVPQGSLGGVPPGEPPWESAALAAIPPALKGGGGY